MSKSEEKEKTLTDNQDKESEVNDKDLKETPEQKLKTIEEKLLRTLAEMENQRRRFEKERQEAFEFGGYNFAKESLALLDNLDRAISSFKSDEKLKDSKDLDKIIDGIEIMNTLNITAGREVGKIKNKIKDAILDGKIKNTYEDAFQYMLTIKDQLLK